MKKKKRKYITKNIEILLSKIKEDKKIITEKNARPS